MKRLIIFLGFTFSCLLGRSQSLSIGTASPHPSAVVEITSDSKGFLLPLVSQLQRIGLSNPAEGLLVYDTSLHRFYQFQNGSWRYILNDDFWVESTSRKFVYNVTDSIGIGTTIPQHRLDVNGDIRARGDVTVAGAVTVNGLASAANLATTGSMNADGSLSATGDITADNDFIVNDPAAILQFKNNSINKVFYQLSGDDLRFGTNAGNANGKVKIRMNGSDVFQVDASSNLALLKYAGSVEYGKLVIGKKIIRSFSSDPGNNYLTVLYGLISNDGTALSLWPSSATSVKVSTGVYDIDTKMTETSPKGSIVVTAAGNTPRICTGRYLSNGVYRVEIFNMSGNRVDQNFYFMINDPLN